MQKNSGTNISKARNRQRRALGNAVPFEEVLRSELQDREIAIGYINALLSDNDEQGVLLALRDVADAMSMGTVAKVAGVNRESLYKMLSGRRDPRFGTVLRVLNGLGIKLRVVDERSAIEQSSETSKEAPVRPQETPNTCVVAGVSGERQTAYPRRRAFNYRVGICPLDPGKRCLDIVPCAPEGAAPELSEFGVPVWSGIQNPLTSDEMAYAA
jgi:probable addiction module antidote protein